MWFGCAPVGGYKSYFCFLVAVKNGDFGVFNRFGGVNSVLPELNKCPWRAGYPLHFVVAVTIERHGRGDVENDSFVRFHLAAGGLLGVNHT